MSNNTTIEKKVTFMGVKFNILKVDLGYVLQGVNDSAIVAIDDNDLDLDYFDTASQAEEAMCAIIRTAYVF